MTQTTYAAITVILLAAACGDDGPASGETPTPAVASEAAHDRAPSEGPEGEPDPCALLTEAVLRATFSVPATTEIDHPVSSNSGRSVCTYLWDKPNAEEVRAEVAKIQQERVREMMQKARRGKRVQGLADLMDLPRVENRVSFYYAPPIDTAEEARARFEREMEIIQEGITHRVEIDDDAEGVTDNARRELDGEEVTFQADAELVEGVGDAARWTPRLNQLAVLDDTRILYFGVEMDVDSAVNLDNAKRLARALLD